MTAIRKSLPAVLVTVEALHAFNDVVAYHVFVSDDIRERQSLSFAWAQERCEAYRVAECARDPGNADIIRFEAVYRDISAEVAV